MYKFVAIVLSSVLIAFVLARPAHEHFSLDASSSSTTTPATIIKQIDITNPDGSFNSSYETSNGILVENIGYMKKILVPQQVDEDGHVIDEHEETILVQRGFFRYMDPEGKEVELRYTADENGFQPQGDHLPKAPQ
uniref:Uncharacterized protein n=1 Tax=Glossina palpalis gambiensis TaxID=67801 RepID=A0A1B0AMA0_9MUSC